MEFKIRKERRDTEINQFTRVGFSLSTEMSGTSYTKTLWTETCVWEKSLQGRKDSACPWQGTLCFPLVASELADFTEEGLGAPVPNLSEPNAHSCCHSRKEESFGPSHLKFLRYQQDSVHQNADQVAALIENQGQLSHPSRACKKQDASKLFSDSQGEWSQMNAN